MSALFLSVRLPLRAAAPISSPVFHHPHPIHPIPHTSHGTPQKQQQKAAFAQMRAEGVFNDEEERRNERKKSQAQQVCARVYAYV